MSLTRHEWTLRSGSKMKFPVITLIVAISLCVTGCAHRKELTFHFDSSSFTRGSIPISNKKALSYLEAPENSESVITVLESGSEPKKMKVSEFLNEADKAVEAINAYYFPEKSVFDESVFKDADQHDPFSPFEPEPAGAGQPDNPPVKL